MSALPPGLCVGPSFLAPGGPIFRCVTGSFGGFGVNDAACPPCCSPVAWADPIPSGGGRGEKVQVGWLSTPDRSGLVCSPRVNRVGLAAILEGPPLFLNSPLSHRRHLLAAERGLTPLLWTADCLVNPPPPPLRLLFRAIPPSPHLHQPWLHFYCLIDPPLLFCSFVQMLSLLFVSLFGGLKTFGLRAREGEETRKSFFTATPALFPLPSVVLIFGIWLFLPSFSRPPPACVGPAPPPH